jgi:hypothetical protein
VAGNDHAVIVDQHRIGETKALDAVGNLSDLLPRVSTRVTLVRDKPIERHKLDAVLHLLGTQCVKICLCIRKCHCQNPLVMTVTMKGTYKENSE